MYILYTHLIKNNEITFGLFSISMLFVFVFASLRVNKLAINSISKWDCTLNSKLYGPFTHTITHRRFSLQNGGPTQKLCGSVISAVCWPVADLVHALFHRNLHRKFDVRIYAHFHAPHRLKAVGFDGKLIVTKFLT